MAVQSRRMQPRDVDHCVELIAAHPVIGPRYGAAINDLRTAWLRLLSCQAKNATVFEKVERSRSKLCFVGVTVFVTDDFVRELKTAPLFWFGPELAKRIAQGRAVILSDKELAEANARDGLNLLVWEGCFQLESGGDPEVPRHVMDVFVDEHKGYRLKELISSQLESPERLAWTLQSGCFLWDAENGRYADAPMGEISRIASTPHIVGITRDLELQRRPWGASWVGTLFDYEPPRFAFTRPEQRLLLSALSGDVTDQELAENLALSVAAIKKEWLSIYDRVAGCDANVIGDNAQPDATSKRGKEKRRRLLAYLRRHPEELRPASPRVHPLQRTGRIS
jgi:hypothetical protein